MRGTLLEKQVRHISIARAVQYGGIAMWALAGPAIFTGLFDGVSVHSWDPVTIGLESAGALYCGGPLIATVGFTAKQIIKHRAKETAKTMGNDRLAVMVRQHGHINTASTAAEIFNIATLLGVALPPPFDIVSAGLHIAGRVVTAAKITHSFGIEGLAWKRLVFPARRR